MTSTWTRTRLGDVARIKHGFAFAGSDMVSGDRLMPIVVGIGNFDYAGGFRFASTTVKRYKAQYPSEFELRPGDVLLAMTCQTSGGEILGIPGTIPDDGHTYLHNQRLGKVEVTDPTRVHLPFLFQLARWNVFNRHLVETASGSKILHTSPGRIEDFEFDLPPLDEQRIIAATLGVLDAKSDSNKRIAGHLQQLVQQLFRSWFVDLAPWGGSAPPNWREGCLSDVLTLIKRPIKAGQRTDLAYVPIDMVPMRALGLEEFRPNEDAQSSLLTFDKDDILIGAMRVYFHRVAIAPFDGITRTTCFVLRPHEREYLDYGLLLCNEDSTIEFAEGASKGSTMPYAVWDGGLASMPVLIPPRETVAAFADVVRPMINHLRDGIFEVRLLSELRDALAPELLSGRTRVPEALEAAA